MDWSKQAEQAVKNWADVQRQLFESWLAPVKAATAAPGGESAKAYRQTLDLWESAVKQALDAQLEWTRLWADSLTAAQGATDPAAACARNTQQMMQAWTDAHKQLWESWFSTLRQWDPAASLPGDLWDKQARSVLHAWEEAAKAAQESMKDWTAKWGAKA
jgi:hypothetical protein